jgi:oxygen-independent coproporphyrinogen-3 oxidase
VGAVSTLGLLRRTNRPRLAPYHAALARGEAPPRREEPLTREERVRELVMLGLRHDEPLRLGGLASGVEDAQVRRLAALGLVVAGGDSLQLTRRGRMVANDVTATLIAV